MPGEEDELGPIPFERNDESDHIGPKGPAVPQMSGGMLLAKGYSDKQLQESWEELCGPQPEDVPRLHKDGDFASSIEGWQRRAFMWNQLWKRIFETR